MGGGGSSEMKSTAGEKRLGLPSSGSSSKRERVQLKLVNVIPSPPSL